MSRILCFVCPLLLAALGAATAMAFLGPWHGLMSNLRAHLAAASLVLALALLLSRHRRSALLSAALLMVNAVPLPTGIELIGPSDAAAGSTGAGEPTLRVLTHNAWGRNHDLVRLTALLRSQDADVILLQEISAPAAPVLDAVRDLYPHQIHCLGDVWCRLALLSKEPWRSAGFRPLGRDNAPTIWATGLGPHAVTVVGTHLIWPLKSERQSREVATLVREIAALPRPLVLAGDLNATPWSAAYRRLTESAGFAGRSWSPASWPVWLGPFGVPIDHVLVTPPARVLSLESGPRSGSDHRPVLATVALPPGISR